MMRAHLDPSPFTSDRAHTEEPVLHRLRHLVLLASRFLTVGAVSTVIEIGVFNLLLYVLGADAVLAKVIASLVALVNAYFGNRLWAFRGRTRGRRRWELVRFLIVNAACTVLGAVLLWAGLLLVPGAGALVTNVVNLATIVVVVVVRFALYAWWVFPGERTVAAEPDERDAASTAPIPVGR